MQARKAMFALRDATRGHASTTLLLDRIPFGYAVMLPDVVFHETDPEWERWQVVDRDTLHHPLPAVFAKLNAEQRKLLHIPASEAEPTRAAVAELVRLIRPDFEVVVTRGAEIEKTEERLHALTAEQYAALDIVEDNPRCLFQGAAGTGKTMLALEAARRAARAGHATLFVCYNNLLGEWIEARVKEDDCGGKLTGGTFHRCLTALIGRSTHAAMLATERAKGANEHFFMETLPFVGQLAMEELGANIDVLVLDEAQDLLVPAVLDGFDNWLAGGLANGRWVIFGDFHRQAIFRHESGPEMIARLEERCANFARGSLKTNCRNTRHIGDVTSLLAGFPSPPYRAGTVDGVAVDRREYTTNVEQCTVLCEVIGALLKGGVPARQIVVLTHRTFENCGFAGMAKNSQFRLLSATAPAPERSRLPIIRHSTVHGFKGMESSVVIMGDIAALGDEEPQRVLYTGLSRARSHLTVLLHRDVLPAYRACLERTFQQSLKPVPTQ
jgi:hypothetical protein